MHWQHFSNDGPQIEFADVVLINKCDLLPAMSEAAQGGSGVGGDLQALQHIKAAVRALNRGAHLVATRFAACPLSEIINTHRWGGGLLASCRYTCVWMVFVQSLSVFA
jgi:G3E family GTPase